MNRRKFCKSMFGLAVTMMMPVEPLPKIKFVGQVHDSLIWELPENIAKEALATFNFTLDEINTENLKLAMLGEEREGTLNFVVG